MKNTRQPSKLLTRALAALGLTAAVIFLGLLFVKGESRYSRSHDEALRQVSGLRETDAALEVDVLLARDFILPNYDSLTVRQLELDALKAAILNPAVGIAPNASPAVRQAVDEVVGAVDRKVAAVEEFKSKNAILRNSLRYLHTLAESESDVRGAERGRVHALAHASFLFHFAPGDRAESQLARLVDESAAGVGKTASTATEASSHARMVFRHSPEVEATIRRVASGEVRAAASSLERAYLAEFARGGTIARRYQGILFLFSILLLGAVIFYFLEMRASAAALAEANRTLESKVEARTRELQDSLRLIEQQQQSILHSSKMSALGEMAGGIAHEVNTPLATISLQVDNLLDSGETGPLPFEELKTSLSVVRRTVDRIRKIVIGLRSFARDGSRDPFQRAAVAAIVSETLVFCKERFHNRNVHVEVAVIPEEYSIECRPVEVSQVLLNLLNNATDAIDGKTEKWIRIGCELEDDAIVISVTDSGSGLPPGVEAKLFQPFFTTKELGKGTGLGLSVSRGIAEGHGGRLMYSLHDGHTRFSLRLPRHQKQASAAPIKLPKAA